METMWQDIRFGFRILFKSPAFTYSAKECSIHSRYLERLGWR
jgi:hypothetical protein